MTLSETGKRRQLAILDQARDAIAMSALGEPRKAVRAPDGPARGVLLMHYPVRLTAESGGRTPAAVAIARQDPT
jgi:hypothetical protein